MTKARRSGQLPDILDLLVYQLLDFFELFRGGVEYSVDKLYVLDVKCGKIYYFVFHLSVSFRRPLRREIL